MEYPAEWGEWRVCASCGYRKVFDTGDSRLCQPCREAGRAVPEPGGRSMAVTLSGAAAKLMLDEQYGDPVERRAIARMRETERLRADEVHTPDQALAWLAAHTTTHEERR